MLNQILCLLGTVVLIHAGYSANQYKTLVYAQSGQDAASTLPPLDVIIECVVAFVLIVVGQLMPLSLESIQLAPSKKFMTFADCFGAPEFVRFDHRGLEMQKRIKRASGGK